MPSIETPSSRPSRTTPSRAASSTTRRRLPSFPPFPTAGHSSVCCCTSSALLSLSALYRAVTRPRSVLEPFQTIYKTMPLQVDHLSVDSIRRIANRLLLEQLGKRIVHFTPLPELGDTVVIDVEDTGTVDAVARRRCDPDLSPLLPRVSSVRRQHHSPVLASFSRAHSHAAAVRALGRKDPPLFHAARLGGECDAHVATSPLSLEVRRVVHSAPPLLHALCSPGSRKLHDRDGNCGCGKSFSFLEVAAFVSDPSRRASRGSGHGSSHCGLFAFPPVASSRSYPSFSLITQIWSIRL